jgi:hypothetical protein
MKTAVQWISEYHGCMEEHDTDHRHRDLADFKTRGQLQSCLIAINLP